MVTFEKNVTETAWRAVYMNGECGGVSKIDVFKNFLSLFAVVAPNFILGVKFGRLLGR